MPTDQKLLSALREASEALRPLLGYDSTDSHSVGDAADAIDRAIVLAEREAPPPTAEPVDEARVVAAICAWLRALAADLVAHAAPNEPAMLTEYRAFVEGGWHRLADASERGDWRAYLEPAKGEEEKP